MPRSRAGSQRSPAPVGGGAGAGAAWRPQRQVHPVLALQQAAGNQAIAGLVASRRVLARDDDLLTLPQAPVCSPGDITERRVDETVSETISHAPALYAQWNGTYSWRAKWRLRLDRTPEYEQLEVVVKLHSTASADVKRAWTSAIVSKWSGRFAFCVLVEDPEQTKRSLLDGVAERYPINVRIDWVDQARDADYVIRANAPGATEGGRAGQGGTTSMTGWGTADVEDVTHEFGHMLGCPEEYFTTDGVDYTAGGTRSGFRDPAGGVMNNPAGPALARNFAFIQRHAATLRGVPLSQTRVQP